MSKIYNINFWIENDAPPPFSENSSVLVPLPVPEESSQKTTPFLGILSMFLVSRTSDSRPPPPTPLPISKDFYGMSRVAVLRLVLSNIRKCQNIPKAVDNILESWLIWIINTMVDNMFGKWII